MLPTTPERRISSNDGDDDIGPVILQCSETQLKVHPHGLSAKKHNEGIIHQEELKKHDAVEIDLPVELGPDGRQENEESVSTHKDERLTMLEQLDPHKMFPDAGQNGSDSCRNVGKLVVVNQSPIIIELSSPIKDSNGDNQDGPVLKKMKLELTTVPNLTQGVNHHQLNDIPLSSPEAIDMVDTKSSPMRETPEPNGEGYVNQVKEAERELTQEHIRNQDQAENDSHEKYSTLLDIKGAIHQTLNDKSTEGTPDRCYDKSEHILSLPRLTPVFHHSGIELSSSRKLTNSRTVITDGRVSDEFRAMSNRNQELIEEIHSMNKRLNDITAECDLAYQEYKILKTELENSSLAYEDEIKRLNSIIDGMSTDQKTFEGKISKWKQKTNEARDEINMLNQNQSILQKKYESTNKEAERWKRLSNEIEESFLEMRSLALDRKNQTQELEGQLDTLSHQLTGQETENSRLREAHNNSIQEVKELQRKLDDKVEEVSHLEDRLSEAIALSKGANDEVLGQIEGLMTAKKELEQQLDTLQKKSKEELTILNKIIDENESRYKSMEADLADARSTCRVLQNEIKEKNDQLATLRREYEELNDENEIHKAETTELNVTISELRESNVNLQSSLSHLEIKLKGLEDTLEREKTSLDKNPEHLKNANIEAEHLAELEDLHKNLTSLQESLKNNSETISQLKAENEILRKNNAAIDSRWNKDHSNAMTTSLQHEIDRWKEKYESKEQESNKSLKLLAEDLYIQYSSKHEQKVKLLKKGYETKYQGKLDKLSLRNEGLTQERDHLKSQLMFERKEKQKLLELIESNRNNNKTNIS